MVREDLVTSAVDFLRDPGTASSPLESRIAFLRSKNLTQAEIDAALARAGDNGSTSSNTPIAPQAPPQYYNQQPMMQQPPPGNYGQYPGGYWRPPPPEPPRRDWRDWFIMATVMGGVSYGLYVVAKRYIYPIVAPPTTPQLEQDKQAIDESFTKAFDLLEQLAKDTDALKASEEARTERLDSALKDIESTMAEIKRANRQREDDSIKISEEVRALKAQIPKAMEAQKVASEGRLKDLNTELKSLKTLVGNRMGGAAASSVETNGASGSNSTNTLEEKSSAATTAPETLPPSGRSFSPSSFPKPQTGNRAAIPAWQMAAAKKSETDSSVGAEA